MSPLSIPRRVHVIGLLGVSASDQWSVPALDHYNRF